MSTKEQEAALVRYLDEEAEMEFEIAGELTEHGKQLRAFEVTVKRLIRERDEALARGIK